ncbi:MAG: hypothetical protein V2J62_10205 [candidate division KSB1 bacterium]|nr:hypothetical protein [candidate division KSB1 bacterium]
MSHVRFYNQSRYCIFVLMIHLLHGNSSPQTPRKYSTDVNFSQNFNIYSWNYGFGFFGDIGKDASLLLREDFRSSLLRIRGNEKKWKDDQRLNMEYTRAFSRRWTGTFSVSSLLFSDKLTGISNDIATNSSSLGLKYRALRNISISSKLGYKFDKRFDILDRGVTYDFGIHLPHFELNEYINRMKFSMNGDEFDRRKNRDLDLRYHVSRHFYKDTSDSLFIHFMKRRTDNYDLYDLSEMSIESLEEDLGTFSNILNYRINHFSKFKFRTRITARRTEVSRLKNIGRSKRDFVSYNEMVLMLKLSFMRDVFKVAITNETQKNDIPDSLKNSPFSSRFSYVSPDYDVSQLTLSNNLDLYAFSRDTLKTFFSISKFQYDTPEEANYDDRDELRISSSMQAIHYLNRFLKLKLNISVNLKHLIYIYGEKSADNNWMRIFSLKPDILYQPSRRFYLYQSFEVLANYVDYDFEESSNPVDVRSFVYRNFRLQNRLRYELSSRTAFQFGYRLELEENGKLFWDRWTEVVITTRQNHYCTTNLEFRPFPSASISPGMVFFMRKENLEFVEQDNGRSNDYISYGPLLRIKYAPHERLNFLFTGTRRTIDKVNQKNYYINNIHLKLMWSF